MEHKITLATTALCFLIFLTTSTVIGIALATPTFQAMPSTARKLVIKLLHPDSLHSPRYNNNIVDNVRNRIKRDIQKSSTVRFAYLQNKFLRRSFPKDNDDDDNFQADLLPSADGGAFFIMNISVGQPPVPQFTLMDTGSSLLWIRCLPCKQCSQQFGAIYDPEKSSTYASLSCMSHYCRYAPRATCNSLDQCQYSQKYIKADPSVGILSRDQLVFKTPDEGSASIPDVIFGCSHEDGEFNDNQISGVFGLGFQNISLVAQLGSKFSYCIGSALDPNYGHNKLIIGDGAVFEGDSTPMEVIDGQYYVTLEGISVGEKKLEIDSNVFKRKTNRFSGVMIDSGATVTWLAQEGFEALGNEVQSMLDTWLTRFQYNSWALCYNGTVSQDLVGFPTVTFHFAGGADLVLDTGSLFVQIYPYAFCMAVFPSYGTGDKTKGLSLIGMLAQQNYNIGYDTSGNTIYFQRIDCELLDD